MKRISILMIMILVFTLSIALIPGYCGIFDISDGNVDKGIKNGVGVKYYTDFLGKHANKGDNWSKLRLDEVNKGLDSADKAMEYEKTSWWSPIDKVSNLYGVYKSEKVYHEASKGRREYEYKLDKAGYNSSGRSAEQTKKSLLHLFGKLGISDVATEGSKLVNNMDKVEESAYKFGETSYLNPIDKYKAYKELKKHSDVAIDQYKNVQKATQTDPIYKVVNVVSNIGNVFSGLFNGNGNNNGRITSNTSKTDDGNFLSNIFSNIFGNNSNTNRSSVAFNDNKKNLEYQISYASNSVTGGLNELGDSLSQLGREFDNLGKGIEDSFKNIGNDIENAFKINTSPMIDESGAFGGKTFKLENVLEVLKTNKVD